MKKLFSMALALVMAMSLTVPAFAVDPTGEVTIDNAKEGEVYTMYKVLDLSWSKTDASGENYAYTINEDFAGVFMKDDPTSDDPEVKIAMTDGEAYDYVAGQSNAADFATVLAAYVKENDVEGVEIAYNANGTKKNLPYGYYLMIPTMAKDDEGNPVGSALFSLDTVTPEVTIKNKSEYPGITKTADDKSVEIGQVVTYTINGSIPNAAGYDHYIYKITDTMSEGLTFNKDVVFKQGVLTISGGTFNGVQFITYDDNNGFELNIDACTFGLTGDFTLTYTATVNEDAIDHGNNGIPNKAELEYSNNPNDYKETEKTPPQSVEVYSSEIIIDKIDGDSNEKLAGAKFVLMNSDGKYYKYEDAKVSWVETQADATEKETDSTGAAKFVGLEAGTYNLVETEAPTGYNLLTAPVEITIYAVDTEVGGVTVSAYADMTKIVKNNTGVELPSTGGMGTTIFTVVGATLMMGAAVLLVTKKKMANEE